MHVSDYFSKIISFGLWLPAVQPCNWVGFRISLSREGAIFRDEIENYFSCSHLARRDRDYHMTILVFRDENEITYCYSRVSRRDRDFTKSFLMVEREKMKLTLTRIPGIKNSRWILVQSADSVVTSSSQWAFEKDQGMSTWRICLAWRKWLVKADVT